jgi:cation diffusion facilitator CzcD-associated flavoprotein CzcO
MAEPATLARAERASPPARRLPVAIVGAGPAGLATARELARRGIAYRLLEKGPACADTWRNLYDSLTLHTGKHMSNLPGLAFPHSTPLFPRRADFVGYLDRYREHFGLHVETNAHVQQIAPGNGRGWILETAADTVQASAVVIATGIVSSPFIPPFEGQAQFQGRIMHSVKYLRPGPFAGRRVLVVGCGNSGAEIASELAGAGVDVTLSVRSGANVVPLTILGVPVQYVAYGLRRLPDGVKKMVVSLIGESARLRRGPPVLPVPNYGPLERIPIIGFNLVDAIRAGIVRVVPGIRTFVARGVLFTDGREIEFDDVILATGFRPALQPLLGTVRLDHAGFAVRRDRVTSMDHVNLYFVGHNYDATGGLMNISRDAPIVAARIASN